MIAACLTEVFIVEVFKTNVQDKFQSALLVKAIQADFDEVEANFDLEDCDRILRVEGRVIDAEAIITLLQKEGFEAKVLE